MQFYQFFDRSKKGSGLVRFDLSSGDTKLSVPSDLAAVVTVMDSTGTTKGIISAGPQPGSTSFTVTTAGRYLVDVSSTGTWTVAVSTISNQPLITTPTTVTTTPSGDGQVSITTLSLIGETVTITNRGSSSVNIDGWRLSDSGGKHIFTFIRTTLPTGGSMTITSGSSASGGKWNPAAWDIWNNNGDTAYLYDGSGKLVSQLDGS
jgi:hypothetical protein